MTDSKTKIVFLMTIFSASMMSAVIVQSYAEEGSTMQSQSNTKDQTGLFSSNANFGEKTSDGMSRITSKVDPGLGHEHHQLAVIIPISDKEYTGTLYYSASEPVQLVTLRGPLEPGQEKGKSVWTKDNKAFYEIIQVNPYTTTGKWEFVGNALAAHTFKSTPFAIDYRVDYEEVKDTPRLPANSVNNVKVTAEFNFDSDTVSIGSFNVFKQMTGYDRQEPQVILQGVVGIEKSMLYRAVDTEFDKGAGSKYGIAHQFSNFGMNVYLEQNDMPIRKITYRDCDFTNYTIDTLYDNDYSYNRASAFVLVDNFVITCKGMQPYHYDYQKYIDEYGVDSVMKMKGMDMVPKTSKDYGID
jgi:hypothetical protein